MLSSMIDVVIISSGASAARSAARAESNLNFFFVSKVKNDQFCYKAMSCKNVRKIFVKIKRVKKSLFRANIVKIGEFGCRVKNVRKKCAKMNGVKNSIFRANIVKIGEFGCLAKNVRTKIRENERCQCIG